MSWQSSRFDEGTGSGDAALDLPFENVAGARRLAHAAGTGDAVDPGDVVRHADRAGGDQAHRVRDHLAPRGAHHPVAVDVDIGVDDAPHERPSAAISATGYGRLR